MEHYTEHMVGEMSAERIQICIFCGEMILDNTEHPDPAVKGYAPGPVYKGTIDYIFGPGGHTTKFLPQGTTSTKCAQRV